MQTLSFSLMIFTTKLDKVLRNLSGPWIKIRKGHNSHFMDKLWDTPSFFIHHLNKYRPVALTPIIARY